ncbi:hypothetical protein ACHAWF_002405 [Thalassiosira exigua]
MDTLDDGVHRREETRLDMENRTYEGEGRHSEADGPPQRVIVPTPSSEKIEGDPYGEADEPLPMALARDQEAVAAAAAHGITMDNDASEITTEIKDSQGNVTDRDRMECDDVWTFGRSREAPPPPPLDGSTIWPALLRAGQLWDGERRPAPAG